jgi:hypothetical protein
MHRKKKLRDNSFAGNFFDNSKEPNSEINFGKIPFKISLDNIIKKIPVAFQQPGLKRITDSNQIIF